MRRTLSPPLDFGGFSAAPTGGGDSPPPEMCGSIAAGAQATDGYSSRSGSPRKVGAHPLVLDIDGTFLETDLLFESFWGGLARDPLGTVVIALRHLRAPQVIKAELAERVPLRLDLLPVRAEILAMARREQAAGREVVLASAADRRYVAALAAMHGLSPDVIGSDRVRNRKGRAKAETLVAAYGERGFDYAGNEPTDRAVWNHADAAIIVGWLPREERDLREEGHPVHRICTGRDRSELLRGFGLGRGMPAALVLLPLVVAGGMSWASVAVACLAGTALLAAIWAVHIVGDLLELEADRLHPHRKSRAFASGALPIRTGMGLAVGLGVASTVMAASLGAGLAGLLAAFYLISLAYLLRLKRLRGFDVIALAALYTILVLAGVVAAGTGLTAASFGTAAAALVALITAKRLSDLFRGEGAYSPADRLSLRVVSASSAGAALGLLALAAADAPGVAWWAFAPAGLWLAHVLRCGWGGRMAGDPVAFALTERVSLGLLLLTVAVLVLDRVATG